MPNYDSDCCILCPCCAGGFSDIIIFVSLHITQFTYVALEIPAKLPWLEYFISTLLQNIYISMISIACVSMHECIFF